MECDMAESLDLIYSKDTPKNEKEEHVRFWVQLHDIYFGVIRLSKERGIRQNTGGTLGIDKIMVHCFGDEWLFYTQRTDFLSCAAALISEFEAAVFNDVRILKWCIEAGNQHILEAKRGRRVIQSVLGKGPATKGQIGKKNRMIRNLELYCKIKKVNWSRKIPVSINSKKESAILEVVKGEDMITPSAFSRHIYPKLDKRSLTVLKCEGFKLTLPSWPTYKPGQDYDHETNAEHGEVSGGWSDMEKVILCLRMRFFEYFSKIVDGLNILRQDNEAKAIQAVQDLLIEYTKIGLDKKD